MQNLEEIKSRFLRNNLSVRLGCIASDLARLKSFSQLPNNQKVIKDLIEESKFFIEWTAPKAGLDIQQELINLQIQLALLNYSLKRKKIMILADKWSKKLLKLSGLIKIKGDWIDL
jgi:hypothetical protein